MKSSSGLFAETGALARAGVAERVSMAIEEAHGPIILIAFIVWLMPRIAITRFRL
jgi:hypothetical protein